MDRKNELEKYIEEYRAERINLKKGKLAEIKTKLQPVFCEKLNFLIQDQLQKNRDVIGNIEIFYLCYLLSSNSTESYESVLGISNDLLFLDKRRGETYWCPKYIYKNLESDMKEVEKRLEKKFVRIEEYELFHLKHLLIKDDWEVLGDCFLELAQEQLPMLTDSGLNFKPELKIMCGFHMDQLQLKSSLSMPQMPVEEDTEV